MKKIIVSVLLLIAMMANVLALASCGGNGGNGGNGGGQTFLPPPTVNIPQGGYDGSEVKIVFYHTMGENLSTVLDKYIAEFNKIYPNITVTHSQEGGYEDVRDNISAELATGGGPNIAYCYPDHVALYRRANKVIALDDLIASTASDGAGGILGMTQDQIDAFIDGYWEEGYGFDDRTKMYTLPFSKSTEVLYYNKTFFEACNKIYSSDIELDFSGNPVYVTDEEGKFVLDDEGNKQTKPNPHKGDENFLISVPTTWDEMEVTLRKIKAIDPNSIPLGYDSESNWFITMCEQYGSGYTSSVKVDGSNFLFDNDTNKSFIKRFQQWFANDWVTTQEIYGAYTSGLFNVITSGAQKSYMSIGSSAGATKQRPQQLADGTYPFEVGITSIPQLKAEGTEGYEPKVISQGPSVCIFTKSNDMEVIASWLFVKYLTTSIEFQAEFSIASGYVPVLETVLENETYNQFLNGAKNYAYSSVNAQGKVINSINKNVPETASSVFAYDETAGTLTMNIGDSATVYKIEKIEGSDDIYVYVEGAEGAKQYLTGAVDKGAYVLSADVAEAKAFKLEIVDDGAKIYFIAGGADGGAYIAALAAKVCMEQADYYYTSPAFVGSAAARDEVGVLLRKCIAYEGADLDAYINQSFKDAVTACKYMAR